MLFDKLNKYQGVILLVKSENRPNCIPHVGCILLVIKPPKINNHKSELSKRVPPESLIALYFID